MKSIILAVLMLFCLPALGTTHTLTFDPVAGATGYRALFSTTQTGAAFITLGTPTTSLTFDDVSFSKPYYVCVQATDGSVWSACSNIVYMGMGNPQHVWPTIGWTALTGIVWSRPPVMRVGGFAWPGPEWDFVGGSNTGMPLAPPTVQIGNIFYCPYSGNASWGDALVQCGYSPQ